MNSQKSSECQQIKLKALIKYGKKQNEQSYDLLKCQSYEIQGQRLGKSMITNQIKQKSDNYQETQKEIHDEIFHTFLNQTELWSIECDKKGIKRRITDLQSIQKIKQQSDYYLMIDDKRDMMILDEEIELATKFLEDECWHYSCYNIERADKFITLYKKEVKKLIKKLQQRELNNQKAYRLSDILKDIIKEKKKIDQQQCDMIKKIIEEIKDNVEQMAIGFVYNLLEEYVAMQ